MPSSASAVSASVGDKSAAGSAGAGGDIGKERDTPAAQGRHLQRVQAVGDGVGHGGTIAQDRPKVEQRG